MFYVSEEFLRRYQEEQEVPGSTLGEAVPLGANLFPDEKKPPKGQRRR